MRLRSLIVVALSVSACRPADTTCPEGTQRCDATCVDLSSSPGHCGACGVACGAGLSCVDGQCLSGCQLPGGFIAEGATEGCLTCDPARSTSGLSPRADGTGCDAGLCHAGACEVACFIAGVIVGDGALNPANPCERCAAATAATTWTTRENGDDCGNAQVCHAGVCGAGCFIDGGWHGSGELNPDQACEHCAPGTSTSAWSARVDGAACGAGQVCGGGACAAQCFIDGALVNDGVFRSPCEQCVPAQSTTGWTALLDGTACAAGRVCAAGVCAPSCFIGQQVVDAGAVNALNTCEACVPARSTTSWSTLDDGARCAGGVCENATCVGKCFVGGALLDAGALDPMNACRACVPPVSTSGYSVQAISTLLTPGVDVTAQGWALVGSGPRSLVDDGGVIVLSTSANGYQLLTRRLWPDGGPFTLRIELRVDAVNPHNTFDSAAAIMGRFTPPFGESLERSQMVYLDAMNVGWADDTQSAPVTNVDGGFRVYELSVDADGGARFSVDGVTRLTRGNYGTNGVIAFGDQTNDANTGSTLSVRSVSLICQ